MRQYHGLLIPGLRISPLFDVSGVKGQIFTRWYVAGTAVRLCRYKATCRGNTVPWSEACRKDESPKTPAEPKPVFWVSCFQLSGWNVSDIYLQLWRQVPLRGKVDLCVTAFILLHELWHISTYVQKFLSPCRVSGVLQLARVYVLHTDWLFSHFGEFLESPVAYSQDSNPHYAQEAWTASDCRHAVWPLLSYWPLQDVWAPAKR